VIGVESLMMILPVANPSPEPEAAPKKRRSVKHKRAKSYDAATQRQKVSACEQQDMIWDEFAMSCADASPPLKSMWNPTKTKTELFDEYEEPPTQRRKLEEDVNLNDMPPSPTPRSGDALVAELLLSPTGTLEDDLSPRRETSTESLTSDTLADLIKSEGPRFNDLLSPCSRGEKTMEVGDLFDFMNDNNRGVWGFSAAC
jgi:hypothetical protein